MTYEETLEYLYQRLPIFQRQGKAALKPDLHNTIALLDALGNPEKKIRSIHVAGTNGKGTSCHAIASILQSAGYKVGLYTSPHLKRFTERIKINGEQMGEPEVVSFVSRIRPVIEKINPSFFEVTVAMAFYHFAKEAVDIAVVETGLGGRLDSTNVLVPEVSLITNIGLDHQEILGETLGEIAVEKAGIIKAHVPVVIGTFQPEIIKVFESQAIAKNTTLNVKASRYRITSDAIDGSDRNISITDGRDSLEIRLDLKANYYLKNLPGIFEVIRTLETKEWKILPEHIQAGLSNVTGNTGLKGRFQQMGASPLVIADVSHNQEGIEDLVSQIKGESYRKLHIVFGTVQDKNVERILGIFPPDATFYFTHSDVPRSVRANDLLETGKKLRLNCDSYENVNVAKKAALSNAGINDLILITGSTFVIAELEEL